ncbi:putative f-box and wd40 domain protein [Rosellinia necatrix]|uniref:Putative f-box and wd40 domain protein n=1 Tax=Rosellinia necatrix TaxID=77044 RepID=A0A1W2TET2_ROSNE|nr:putative f-box and wd40 domain protein [Rosellinia necatrix]
MGLATAEGPLPTLRAGTHHGPSASNPGSYSRDARMRLDDQRAEPRRPATANPFRAGRSASTCLSWRRQQKNTFLGEDDFRRNFTELAIEKDKDETENGSPSGQGASLTRRIRRASLTLMKGIVGRDRRRSETAVDYHDCRPTTAHSAWNRIRQATSFRHLRTPHDERTVLETIYSPLESSFPEHPVPGSGFAPPIIPRHTGAAAKAAAAMQNEYLAFKQHHYLSTKEFNDRESGIGIAVTTGDTQVDTITKQDTAVVRLDFVHKLPQELSIHILAYLDAAQLGTASQVSQLWNRVIKDQYIWRLSFLREKTHTYATSLPVQPGIGAGVPSLRPENDWQKIYKAREELDRRWKIGTEARAVYLNGHLDSIYCLQFDENKIITGSRDKTIRIWDMRTLQCRLVIGPPEVVNETSILFDPNGKPIHYASSTDNHRTNPSVPVTVSFPVHHKASILCLQYDDDILVTGSSDATCIIYSVKSGYRPVRRLQCHTAAVLDLAFDNKHIVTCSKDITICVWDRETGNLLKQLRGHKGPVNSVQLRGNTIVSCSGDFSVRLWNIDSAKTIREFAGHTKGLACSQFSEDGRFIASAGSDKIIRIWDANTGERLRDIPAHDSLVRSLHLDSVSGRLISGSYDTDIKVFDMETGEQLLNFPRWHASWVLSAKCDYRRIISTGQDPKILIMDFGADIPDIHMLESARKYEVACDAGFI